MRGSKTHCLNPPRPPPTTPRPTSTHSYQDTQRKLVKQLGERIHGPISILHWLTHTLYNQINCQRENNSIFDVNLFQYLFVLAGGVKRVLDLSDGANMNISFVNFLHLPQIVYHCIGGKAEMFPLSVISHFHWRFLPFTAARTNSVKEETVKTIIGFHRIFPLTFLLFALMLKAESIPVFPFLGILLLAAHITGARKLEHGGWPRVMEFGEIYHSWSERILQLKFCI